MRKQQRLRYILLVLSCLAFATGLALYALRENISYFFTPSQVYDLQQKGDQRVDGVFRLGGLVKKGSLQKTAGDMTIRFVVTDEIRDMNVEYKGIAPDLFREGQGVVARGSMAQDTFMAAELLAKHDEKYTPPELKKQMQKAHDEGVKKAPATGMKKENVK